MSVNNDKQKQELAAFDIDGTITHESFDSWYATTRELVADKEQFDNNIAKWQDTRKLYPYQASLRMMQSAIDLLPDNLSSKTVYDTAKSLFEVAIDQDKIRFKAIEEMDKHLSQGRRVVLATTSYSEIALALVDVLCDHLLIPNLYKKQISLCGTDIHWKQKIIVHFNMCAGKLEGVSRALGVSQEYIEQNMNFAYGDDPFGNDKQLLTAAKNSFIVSTKSNKQVDTDELGTRLSW